MLVSERHHTNYTEWLINRPERLNSLGVGLGEQLLEKVTGLRQRSATDQPRVLVIRPKPVMSRGKMVAIAGGDLKELADLNRDEAEAYSACYHDICTGLEALPIPVVFVVDGLLIGGGIELSLAADIIICTDRSFFSFKQTRIGLATGYGGGQRLIAAVGRSRAKAWLLTAAQIDSKQALLAGLVHCRSKTSELAATQLKLIEDIARNSAEGLRVQKQMLSDPSRDRLQAEHEAFVKLWGNQDHQKFLDQFRG